MRVVNRNLFIIRLLRCLSSIIIWYVSTAIPLLSSFVSRLLTIFCFFLFFITFSSWLPDFFISMSLASNLPFFLFLYFLQYLFLLAFQSLCMIFHHLQPFFSFLKLLLSFNFFLFILIFLLIGRLKPYIFGVLFYLGNPYFFLSFPEILFKLF